MIGKIIAVFKASAALALGAVDTATQVTFGAVATGNFGVFSMAADGVLSVLKSTGSVTVQAVLTVGGVDSTNTGIFVGRLLRNGVQVGEAVSVSVVGAGENQQLIIEHHFDSLSGGDEITVEFGLDDAGSATTGGTVLITPTSALSSWGPAVPAKLTVIG